MTTPDPSSLTPDQARYVYKRLVLASVVLLTVGTVAYRVLEDWSWVDSFYFSVVAVATVGFGDITPTSDGSKLFTVVYILAGISIFATYLDARMKYHTARRYTRHKS